MPAPPVFRAALRRLATADSTDKIKRLSACAALVLEPCADNLSECVTETDPISLEIIDETCVRFKKPRTSATVSSHCFNAASLAQWWLTHRTSNPYTGLLAGEGTEQGPKKCMEVNERHRRAPRAQNARARFADRMVNGVQNARARFIDPMIDGVQNIRARITANVSSLLEPFTNPGAESQRSSAVNGDENGVRNVRARIAVPMIDEGRNVRARIEATVSSLPHLADSFTSPGVESQRPLAVEVHEGGWWNYVDDPRSPRSEPQYQFHSDTRTVRVAPPRDAAASHRLLAP
jgi:hypothetical protein